MIGTRLAWVALVVSDVEAVASALARDFGLRRTDCRAGDGGGALPAFGLGGSALVLAPSGHRFVAGETRTGLHHLAVEVPDVRVAAGSAAASGVSTADARIEAGLAGAPRLGLSPAATAGVRIYLSEPVSIPAAGASLAERIDHVGVASTDNAASLDLFCRRLGWTLESTQTDLEVQLTVESFTSDKYGAVYHPRAATPVGGLRVAFVTVGDTDLELLEDFDPRQGAVVEHGRPGTTRQDRGAIARFVASRGPGLHHLALRVADIDGALGRLARAGHGLIDRAGRPGSRRARIGFVHPRSLGGVLVHLVQRD
jgi:catechol 2,3-dioxygenase-like lactoylglutathione lyase family enzyme